MDMRLDLSSLDGWRMAGYGGFIVQPGDILETEGGPGLLWYTRQEFGDFGLEVEWRIASLTDNSGVFIRIPPLGSSDPARDWKPAVEQGYEIQIDERGVNPEAQTLDDPLHHTGRHLHARAGASPCLTLGRSMESLRDPSCRAGIECPFERLSGQSAC
jgi:hypothetical protein